MSAAPIMDRRTSKANAVATGNAITGQPPVKQRRGRKKKQTNDTPCPDCLQRASSSNTKGAVSLCADCARTIGHATKHAPRPAVRPTFIPKQHRAGISKPNYQRQAASNVLRATARASSSTTPPPPPPPPSRPDPRSAKDKLVDLPAIFDNLNEAYNALLPVHGRLAALIMGIESSVQTVITPFSQDTYRIKAQRWLASWETAYAHMLRGNIEFLTSDERKAALTLKAHHLIAKCFASAELNEGQLDWGAFAFEFEAILNLADEVMRDIVFPPQHVHRRSIDSFQTTLPRITILDPVYEVRIRTSNMALVDWATQLQATIQTTQLVASPEQSFYDLQGALQEDPLLVTTSAPPLDIQVLPR